MSAITQHLCRDEPGYPIHYNQTFEAVHRILKQVLTHHDK
jgi:hypothetical protein